MGSGRLTARNTVAKLLRCAECGFEQSIRRRRSKDRPTGHYKHLYCIQCKTRTAHVELGVI